MGFAEPESRSLFYEALDGIAGIFLVPVEPRSDGESHQVWDHDWRQLIGALKPVDRLVRASGA